MDRAIFAISAFLSLVSWVVVARLFIWPWLRSVQRDRALMILVAPHLFLRFIGLSFLVIGVVSPNVPSAFAVPAAYGDLVAGLLALIAIIALSKQAWWATAAVWVFNLWGTADLLLAAFQGRYTHLDPGSLGAAFYIPTAIVPPLFVIHVLIFMVLVRREGPRRVVA